MEKRRWRRGCCAAFLALLLTAGCRAPQTTQASSLPEPPDAAPPILTETEETTMPETRLTEQTAASTENEAAPTQTDAAETEAPSSSAELRLARMTLEERVAQLFFVTPEALCAVKGPITATDEQTRTSFDRIPVGGLLLMGQNLREPEQTKALLAGLRALSRDRLGLPLFLGVDEEGGSVARISGNPAFGLEPIPDMAEIGASGDPQRAWMIGRTMGAYLRELGFNLDFAPVADVLTNEENTVVRRRSFGRDAESVTAMADALAEGLLEAGVLPCWKHFPGHGGTAEDSHKGFAVSQRRFGELPDSEELAPFAEAARRGAPMIMTGHITVPDTPDEALPASLSKPLIDLLRGPELNYDGLLITDALSMGAVTQRFSPGEAAVLAFAAGNDLLLVSDHLNEAYEAVLRAVEDGTIPTERLDESVLRILRAKEALQ